MKYKYLNLVLVLIMAIGSAFLCLYRISLGKYGRITTDLAVFLVLVIPFVLKKMKLVLTDKEKFIFYSYIFIAQFLGCVVNLFKVISWFDTLSHFLAGVFFFLVGLKLLHLFKQYDYKKVLFNLVFIFGIVFMSAGVWEIFEYTLDIVSGSDLQHNIDTGVVDTMIDMIACFGGGIVTSIFYVLGLKKN